MPGLIESFVLLALTSAGVTGAALTIGVSLIAGAIGIGLSVGLSYLASSLFRPEPPKPEDVQVTVKSPVAPRQRHYGRVKTSGSWVFAESKNGGLHKVLALGTGELDAIEELWVDDNLVVNSGSGGLVPTAPYNNRLRLQTRLGLATETHYSHLTGNFPEWTSAHRGDGVSSIYAIQHAVAQDQISSLFPNLSNTLYRVVTRGSKVLNPSTGLTAWSDNAAAIIRDYITHSDGMRLPVSLVSTPQAAAGWLAAYNRAAEAVERKAGGTEPRYRLWGTYRFDERPADVLGRFQECCDGRIVPTPDGGVTLDIGTWEEPTVILDEDAIVGFSELARGRDILTTANTIRATYLSPTHDYQSTDADQWIDDADAALRGEIATDKQFLLAPSHGQARRLMKLAAYRANPSWVGGFQCNLKALAAFGKRFVRIRYPLFGIDEVFEVQDFRFNIGEGGILTGVSLQVISMPAAAYAWDAATEEGTAPISEDVVVDRTIPVPTGLSFGVNRITIGGQQVPVGVIQFDAPPSDALIVEGRYKRTAVSEWQVIPIGDKATEAQTGALSDGDQYEAQVRHITITGRQGAWSASQTVTVVADTTAPGVVTNVTKSGGAGTVDLGWKSPNSANYSAANIRRNTVNTEGTATLVRTEYGGPSANDTWQDTGLAAGNYYYWIKARNASGVESASVATGSVTVT
ncbi:fibronectin type III domain-containing protein [Aminobacter sp. MDW-2]|uniref:fibronectin type III domain-containing protein n=1 Tax=Aminobacter sp. MDW-2 TaxID=2666139 RepID=UPI0012B1463B|nr:fibronectin type III domain-containing protein [Aminobacter sp. MDW-2]MRX33228.1 fibronectin type III domain-containing protein [Aminobacter sp. MDW-2]QNH36847.1 fibronectin type III domain-containing protein [Aminobacter sp. MDW-2]